MATLTPNRSTHATLTATTVDTVTLTVIAADKAAGAPYTEVNGVQTYHYNKAEVINRDAAALLYITVDGSAPTAAGDGTFVVLPGQTKIVNLIVGQPIKLISAGTPAYSVHGVI